MDLQSDNRKFEKLNERVEETASQVVDAAYMVHQFLGPGLLESAYRRCLVAELTSRKVPIEEEVRFEIYYRGMAVGAQSRLDLLVDGSIVVELKAVEQLLPVHEAQLLTYLRLTGNRLGFLINFNVPLVKLGIRRFVN